MGPGCAPVAKIASQRPPLHAPLLPHAFPQLPQLFGSTVVSTHVPPQSVYPVLQVIVQLLCAHAGCAWTRDVVHACPHEPQAFALLVVSTHVAPHGVGVLEGHAATHA